MNVNSAYKCLLKVYNRSIAFGVAPVRNWKQGYQNNVSCRFEILVNLGRSLLQIKCLKLSCYKCPYFLLFWLLSTVWIYHFNSYSMSFLPLYLSFHLDSLRRHPDSPHFSHFHPDFRISLLNPPHLHIHLILAFPPLFSTFPLFRSPIPYFCFYRKPALFAIFKNFF